MTKAHSIQSTLDAVAIAAGIGEVKDGAGYARILVGGKTLAYVKKGRMAVPMAHVTQAPKKLGTFTAEKNGAWANVPVASTEAARAVVEYVVAQAAAKKEAV